jgi:hypothetical protein
MDVCGLRFFHGYLLWKMRYIGVTYFRSGAMLCLSEGGWDFKVNASCNYCVNQANRSG